MRKYRMKKEFNEYEIRDNYVYLFLINKKGICFETIIDIKNLELIKNTNLRFHAVWKKECGTYYACACKYLGIFNGHAKYKIIYLHHIIKPLPKNIKMRTDHKNHNGLDNREENLIIVFPKNNSMNRRGINSNNTSGRRNVSWIQKHWRVQIQINGKNHLFSEKFENIDEAGIFAQKMRIKYYGKFAGNG
jgi:hypothetical protein